MQNKNLLKAEFSTSSQIWKIEFVPKIKELLEFQKKLGSDKFLLSPYLNAMDQKILNSALFYPQDFCIAISLNPKTTKSTQIKFLEELEKTEVEASKVYLIGKKWLKLDIDDMTKTSNGIDFIFFQGKVLKTIPSKELFKQKLENFLLNSGSILYQIQI